MIGCFGLAAATAHADSTTKTIQQVVELDVPGSAQVEKFDPALGTLTAVDYTVESSVRVQVCLENQSTAASAVPGGTSSGSLTATIADASATASASVTVPDAQVGPAVSGLACEAAYDAASNSFPSAPSGSDLLFVPASNSATDGGSATAATLASWIGPGTVDVTWSGASAGDIQTPSEWSIFNLQSGTVTATVVYTYTPNGSTTTIVSGATTVPPTTTVQGATTTLPAVTTTTIGGELPRTGGNTDSMTWIAGALVLAGGAVVVVGAKRRKA